MDGRAFKQWRKQLGLSQEEAAKRLDVARSTIQNWEYEITPLPSAIDCACQECVRRWKQRPNFGPVLLVYTDGLIWAPSDQPDSVPVLYCEPYPDNEAAIERAVWLRAQPSFANAWILEEDEKVIWNSSELLLECDRRSSSAAVKQSMRSA